MPHGLREEELVLLSTGKSNCGEREIFIDSTWMDVTRFISVAQSLFPRKSSSNLNLFATHKTVSRTTFRSTA
jgi:hypothetical protein